jgi:hypothetical protein
MVTDAFTSGMCLLSAILDKMHNITKWRKDFFIQVIILFLTIKGKINFTQMERYSSSLEVRFRNMFKKKFDFASFNSHFIRQQCSDELIIGFDPSYLQKSGKLTNQIGQFFSGVAGVTKRGIELGCLAIIDIKQNTAYHFDAVQTLSVKKNEADTKLVRHYVGIIRSRAEILLKHSSVLAVDAWFYKKNFVEPMIKMGFEVISRLTKRPNLRYLYTGERTGKKGRPSKYAGKVNVKNIDKKIFKTRYQDELMIIYEAVVYSVCFERNIKVAYVEFLDNKGKVRDVKMYYSTNTSRCAIEIVKYYRARFQMEFIFRDGKQFTGLATCQARSENKIYNHVNYSMTAVNVAKGIIRKGMKKDEICVLSIQDVKTELFNQFLLERIFINYGISSELLKNIDLKRNILDIGKVAA